MDDVMNYRRATKFPYIRLCFFYLDTQSHLADNLFKKHKIRAKLIRDLSADGDEYHIIVVTIPRRHRHGFEQVMRELRNKMLVCGHTDYVVNCLHIANGFFTGRKDWYEKVVMSTRNP